jgi:hypothetical protein
MKRRIAPIAAWSLAIATIVGFAVMAAAAITSDEFAGAPVPEAIAELMWSVIAAAFAVLGALILSRQPDNMVGWTLMTPPVGLAAAGLASLPAAALDSSSVTIDLGLWLALWLTGISWLFLIFPIFHLLQIFPTGRVLTPRWRWLVVLEVVMVVVFLALSGFSGTIETADGQFVENPIGFIDDSFWAWFDIPWTAGLLTLMAGGAISMFVRFRRSRGVERQQMKWLLLAVALFVLVYGLTASQGGEDNAAPLELLFPVAVLAIPVAITFAVLRYRLFDIDLIIRRTLLYAMLTGLLTAVYLGSVVATQTLFRGGGDSSTLSVAASTLLITVLFAPLRRRLQAIIDRRLFRSRYNAQLVIEGFAGAARNQANLEALSADLITVLAETIQPRSSGIWIRE